MFMPKLLYYVLTTFDDIVLGLYPRVRELHHGTDALEQFAVSHMPSCSNDEGAQLL